MTGYTVVIDDDDDDDDGDGDGDDEAHKKFATKTSSIILMSLQMQGFQKMKFLLKMLLVLYPNPQIKSFTKYFTD